MTSCSLPLGGCAPVVRWGCGGRSVVIAWCGGVIGGGVMVVWCC